MANLEPLQPPSVAGDVDRTNPQSARSRRHADLLVDESGIRTGGLGDGPPGAGVVEVIAAQPHAAVRGSGLAPALHLAARARAHRPQTAQADHPDGSMNGSHQTTWSTKPGEAPTTPRAQTGRIGGNLKRQRAQKGCKMDEEEQVVVARAWGGSAY